MVITAHFEAKGMDSGFQNYLSTIAETSNQLWLGKQRRRYAIDFFKSK